MVGFYPIIAGDRAFKLPPVLLLISLWLPIYNCLQADDPTHVMSLSDGSICYGSLQPNSSEGQIAFKIDGLIDSIAFPQNSVQMLRRISQASPEKKPTAVGTQWVFRLKDQQAITGELESWNAEKIRVKTSVLGVIEIAPENLVRIDQDTGTAELLKSVFKKAEWSDPNDSNAWKVDPTRISTAQPGVRLMSEFAVSGRCEIRMSLRWSAKANFAIGFGVNKANSDQVRMQWGVPEGKKVATVGRKEAFASIETWENELVLVRESNTATSIESLGELTGNSRELTVFIDIKEGVFAVRNIDGRLIRLQADSKIVAGKVQAMQLQNFAGTLAVENVEILKWNGQLPLDYSKQSSEVQQRNGQKLDGYVAGYDDASKSWIVKSGETQQNVPVGDLVAAATQPNQVEGELKGNSSDSQGNATENDDREKPLDPDTTQIADAKAENKNLKLACSITLIDGSQFAGELLTATEGLLQVKSNQFDTPLKIPVDSVRAISAGSSPHPPADDKEIWIARCGLTELRGKLIQDVDQPRGTALLWQPTLGLNFSELDYDQTGEIMPVPKVIQKPAPTQSTTLDKARAAPLFLGGLFGAPVERKAEDKKPKEKTEESKSVGPQILFRSGDSTPAKILQITEGGVRFESERTTTTFAPNSSIDQIVFRATKKATLSPEQRKRLLTVPRAQQNDPPTHLVISVAGDFVRGRLIEVNGDQALMEVRGEELKLPVAELSEIVWLYDRDWKTPREKDAEQAPDKSSSRKKQEIYAVYGVERGVSLVPTAVKDGLIIGTSDLLGTSQVALADLVVLFWGPNIGQKARELRNENYRLTLAQMPREAPEGEGASTQSTAHPLVGKAAPKFSLKNLSGDKVQLDELRGKVVVLDFWATWCGPCMQTMPLLDQMMAQFDPNQVRLIAVNIQEQKNRIQLALSKLGIDPEVALDLEGEIAAAYQANAIPQTVIIDREGTVVKVFVGGGAGIVGQIQAALVEHLETSKN